MQRLFERFDEQILLAGEVPVEAAVRQMQIFHQVADSGALAAPAPEAPRRGPYYALARLLFVFGWVSHAVVIEITYIISQGRRQQARQPGLAYRFISCTSGATAVATTRPSCRCWTNATIFRLSRRQLAAIRIVA